MAFWGCVLKPGQKSLAKLSESDVLHLSQACLHQPKAGKNYLQVQREGKVYSVACLEKDKREHECFDLFFDGAETTFTCKGESEIHLMGYIEPMDDGMEESEEDMTERQAVPKQSPKASPKDSPKNSPKVAPVEAAKSPKVSPKVPPKTAPAPAAKSPKVSPKVSPKTAPALDDEDDDDEEGEEEELSEEDEEEELLDEDDEEEEEEAAANAAAVSAQLAKRKAASQPGSPSKKPKSEPAVAAPADGAAAYVKSLVKFLIDNGPTNIGMLGSKVPRPNGVPKMKAVLDQNKDKFAVAGDKVTAK